MVSIREIKCPTDKYSIKCPYAMTPEFVVIHNTANKAPAKNEISYMQSNNNEVSFHYAVDDIEAVQGIPLNRNAWHASDGGNGKGNRKGIAIEICYSYCSDEATWKKSYKKKFEKAQENAAELTAYLLHKYGWGMDTSRIKKHEDFAKKHCPHRTLDDYGWTYFINLVKAKYKAMYEKKEESMTTAEKKAFDELTAKVEKLEQTLSKYEKSGVYDNAAIRWAYIDGNLPSWATPTIKKLVNKGHLKGGDKNSLELSNVFMRVLVILDRAGVFGK